MTTAESEIVEQGKQTIQSWRDDWCKLAREAFGVRLDKEQEDILSSVQHNKRTSVASGTARGKDFVAAVASLCFLYMTPRWNKKGEMTENTKVALTAPTERQIGNIMMPEIARLFNQAQRRGVNLPGRLLSSGIRTDWEEWFLTGFKADEHNHEAWTGFHAVNTMFAITEASGVPDSVFDAIEGNLQGNSRILLVFNPNVSTGYAARSQRSEKWNQFRLNSLTAPNVVEKENIIPGQVDYEWIVDKIENWCMPIPESDVRIEEDDFFFENKWYRPEDLFRVKVLGKFPKIGEDVLIPRQWIELAQERWKTYVGAKPPKDEPLTAGQDVAGMGRDSSVRCYRYGHWVDNFKKHHSGGRADHMRIAGEIQVITDNDPNAKAFIDTIGEGAGVYSRLVELGKENSCISAKASESAKDRRNNDITDITGQYKFVNMRSLMSWRVREWLDPKNNTGAMLPPSKTLLEEATEIKWEFRSDGKILIEPKEKIRERIGRSPDEFDALALTFYPEFIKKKVNIGRG